MPTSASCWPGRRSTPDKARADDQSRTTGYRGTVSKIVPLSDFTSTETRAAFAQAVTEAEKQMPWQVPVVIDGHARTDGAALFHVSPNVKTRIATSTIRPRSSDVEQAVGARRKSVAGLARSAAGDPRRPREQPRRAAGTATASASPRWKSTNRPSRGAKPMPTSPRPSTFAATTPARRSLELSPRTAGTTSPARPTRSPTRAAASAP